MSTTLIPIGTEHSGRRDLSHFLANLAPETRRAYAGHLRRYGETGRHMDRRNVVEWLAEMARAGKSKKTVQQALAAVKLAVREAHYDGQVDAATADSVRTIDVGWAGRERGERVGRWLEHEQVKELFRTIDKRATCTIDLALV